MEALFTVLAVAFFPTVTGIIFWISNQSITSPYGDKLYSARAWAFQHILRAEQEIQEGRLFQNRVSEGWNKGESEVQAKRHLVDAKYFANLAQQKLLELDKHLEQSGSAKLTWADKRAIDDVKKAREDFAQRLATIAENTALC